MERLERSKLGIVERLAARRPRDPDVTDVEGGEG
jgi:hypothetical protein